MRNRKRDADSRAEWEIIWARAWRNMPQRYREYEESYWFKRADQHPALPEFIVAQAKGKMAVFDGVVHEWVSEQKPEWYGQQALLARLLGYWVNSPKNGKRPAHSTVWVNWCRGSIPNDPVKRELLLRLAEPGGNAVAWQMITELGIAHRYRRR